MKFDYKAVADRQDFLAETQLVTAADCEKLEKTTGIPLPAEYRDFVLELGFLMINGHLIKGIYKSLGQYDSFEPQLDNPIKLIKRISKMRNSREPFLIIEDDGGGYTILLGDHIAGDKVESWDNDGGWYMSNSWPSFVNYFRWACGEE